MSSPERQLRLAQCGLIVFIVVCFFVRRIGRLEIHDALSPVQWLIIVAAIWSAISGFTVQRRIIAIRSSIRSCRKIAISLIDLVVSANAFNSYRLVLRLYRKSVHISGKVLRLRVKGSQTRQGKREAQRRARSGQAGELSSPICNPQSKSETPSLANLSGSC
jgi:hypothetical protein